MNVDVLIVDPQNDFTCEDDGHGNKGALYVPGAEEDMRRLSRFIRRTGPRLNDIKITMDAHRSLGIERPGWWVRESDRAPTAPFTCLGIHPDGRRVVRYIPGKGPNANMFGMVPTEESYTTRMPSYLHQGGPTGKGSFGYLEALAARKRYPHFVWPAHCVIGSWGFGIFPELHAAVTEWEREQVAIATIVTKGSNPSTEHFSAVGAEVEDPSDPSTRINMDFIRSLEEADKVVLTGEALSHCVASTVRGIAENFSDPRYIEKLVLFTDCTSNVAGFDFLGDAFIQELVKKGMTVTTSDAFMA